MALFWITTLLGISLILGLSHLVGSRLANFRHCGIGNGRNAMPTLVLAEDKVRGRADKRWQNSVRRVERLILKHFSGDAIGVRASTLAMELGEAQELVEATLERMREEITCRVRVTRSGELLHDFDSDTLDILRQNHRRRLPFRLLLVMLAALANISSIWPVLMVLFASIITLDFLLGTPSNLALGFGLIGLGTVVSILFLAWAGSTILDTLLTPLTNKISLGYSHYPDIRSTLQAMLKVERVRENKNEIYLSSTMVAATTHAGYPKFYYANIDNKAHRRFSGITTGRGGGGAAHLVLIVVFIAIMFTALFILFVWGRGLYRAVTRQDVEVEKFGPAEWTRLVDDADWYERFLPTNDLISRMSRAVRRALRHRRPGDLQMAGRIIARAVERDKPISALDIALDEALSPTEVAEIGARLCQRFDGELLIAENGELLFDLDRTVLAQIDLPWGPDFEYLERPNSNPQNLKREGDQPPRELPVNMVGLKLIHLQAGNFLAGGSLMMFVTSLYLYFFIEPASLQGVTLSIPPQLGAILWQMGPLFVLATFLLAMGTISLVATTRYLANTLAIEGVQRDARRVFSQAIRDAIHNGEDKVDLSLWIDRLERRCFAKIHARFDRDFFQKECEAILIDFGLLDECEFDHRGYILPIPLASLAERMDAISAGEWTDLSGQTSNAEHAPDPAGYDDIVFDTKVKKERAVALDGVRV